MKTKMLWIKPRTAPTKPHQKTAAWTSNNPPKFEGRYHQLLI
jgi:hypothetical protein